jgi:hypothetical protein
MVSTATHPRASATPRSRQPRLDVLHDHAVSPHDRLRPRTLRARPPTARPALRTSSGSCRPPPRLARVGGDGRAGRSPRGFVARARQPHPLPERFSVRTRAASNSLAVFPGSTEQARHPNANSHDGARPTQTQCDTGERFAVDGVGGHPRRAATRWTRRQVCGGSTSRMRAATDAVADSRPTTASGVESPLVTSCATRVPTDNVALGLVARSSVPHRAVPEVVPETRRHSQDTMTPDGRRVRSDQVRWHSSAFDGRFVSDS